MDWLNYHHLRYFYTIASEGSLRAAAEKLGVSQPSISTQLRLLESALGEPLFYRTGRSLLLTDAGQLVMHYAEEIFSTGRELLSAVRQRSGQRLAPVYIGIADGVPKLTASEILRPVFEIEKRFRVVCREGKLVDLLPQLAAHRLDIVLADEPASTTASMKVFNHSLGNCGVTFCAVPLLAKRLAAHFPKSLDDAPALLPSENTALRMTIERWFHEQGVRPRTLGEFEDPALMKAVAGEVQAVFPLHSIAVAEATQRFGFKTVGKAKGCRIDFYAITAERRIKHPAVAALTENAQTRILKSK